jgi:hypothetical protein
VKIKLNNKSKIYADKSEYLINAEKKIKKRPKSTLNSVKCLKIFFLLKNFFNFLIIQV